jgi:hypothetical protein
VFRTTRCFHFLVCSQHTLDACDVTVTMINTAYERARARACVGVGGCACACVRARSTAELIAVFSTPLLLPGRMFLWYTWNSLQDGPHILSGGSTEYQISCSCEQRNRDLSNVQSAAGYCTAM